jgi:hypothetical protein
MTYSHLFPGKSSGEGAGGAGVVTGAGGVPGGRGARLFWRYLNKSVYSGLDYTPSQVYIWGFGAVGGGSGV